jgi:DNA replication protein DnaC
MDQHGAQLCFPLISRRYARGSSGLTSNQRFGPWGEVVGTTLIATALLDRLVPHRVVITIQGEASRLREKQKAGVLKQPEPALVSSPRVGIFRAS